MSENNKYSKKEKNAKRLINEVKQTVKKEISINIPKSQVVFKKNEYYYNKPKLTHVEYTIKI